MKTVQKKRETVEVTVTFTREQYEALKDLCGRFRMDVAELAKATALVELDSDDEILLNLMQYANEDRDTGTHPAFEYWREKEEAREAAESVKVA